MTIARVLVIAGSDSGGGAGVQADIKTVAMLGGHPMTAITAITAQNTLGVQAVHPVPTDAVLAQIASIADDIGVDAVKIGMIGSAETAHAVADWLERLAPFRHPGPVPESTAPRNQPSARSAHRWTPAQSRGDERGGIPVVFDPVMVATSGSVLAAPATIAAFARLMRLATVMTPNLPELEALTGAKLPTEADALAWAHDLAAQIDTPVLAKGGHLAPSATAQELRPDGSVSDDLLADNLVMPDGTSYVWTHPRIDTPHTHGTGCTLASGIAAGLAQGLDLPDATARAIAYVQAALAAAPGLGGGHGPMGHALGQVPFDMMAGRCRA